MQKRKLGQNGPEVSAIGLGCMSFASFFGSTDEATSLACLDAAVEAGIDFWDTSNIYGMGVSERVIGTYLAQKKPKVTLATKVGIVPGPPRSFNNQADYIRSELDGSLKRLNRDRVELYYIHRREQERPIEEVAETMARLIEEGLIGGYGLSEVAPSTLRRAHAVHPCMAVQNEYSLWTRQPELGMIQTCKELGVAFIPFSPLARGMFGETSVDPTKMEETDWRKTSPRFTEPNYGYNNHAIEGFRDLCRDRGWSVSAAALAWVLDKGDHLIPIPGTRTAEHLKEWLSAVNITLSDADRAAIEQVLPVGFAHGDRYSDQQMIGVERYS
ncbi:aldo/keto reductase [Actibacterium lipolyticum]|uniref:General stress protein 69 n=1 Tax=Actibacterium lipolyticum TaxID=1524263 RepID=A0A238JLV0_9RHOB|nr:aldo/keto reductase [Actibacterium lipolyticum]SMX31174.1 General stress protein 69 [Actibacterium lipolyticum]